MIALTIEGRRLELPLAFEHKLERVAKVCLCFFKGFSLLNCRRNLFYEAGAPTFSSWLKYCRKLHALSVSQRLGYKVAVKTAQQRQGR